MNPTRPGPSGSETVAPRPYELSEADGPLSRDELELIDAWWRAATYISVGQIYLVDNPLLRESLAPDHIKPRLLGHFGTVPGLNLVWAHLNRLIRSRELDAVFVAGPGHGGPGPNACAWLEGAYSERYSHVSQDEDGLRALFRQFSFPGGVPSHCAPETPGSFHEGGELGYSLLHAYGAVLDHPDLLAVCVVGDGEAETGPLATSWHCNKLIDPRADGAVLPVLALNGYKIANPTLLARIDEAELDHLLRGYGYRPIVVAGDDPAQVHQAIAAALEECVDEIAQIQQEARADGVATVPQPRRAWPMIVLRTPKGWTGPIIVDGQPVEGTFRAHQVPLSEPRGNEEHLRALEQWMHSYRPEDLFDSDGAPVESLRRLSPIGDRKLSMNPVSNGGSLLKDLTLPDWTDYAVEVKEPAEQQVGPTGAAGPWLRDITTRNPHSFLTFAPDELASNRLQAVLEVTGRRWEADLVDGDDRLSRDGRVVEILSEHVCQGLLEGYLLSGRHGLFTCYEAFIHIIDSMFNQHAKWLESSAHVAWRNPLASLTYLLSSHVWRQDHNGFSHQDPGFIDVVMNKQPSVARVYLPPDANTLLATLDHCLRSRHLVNVVVAGKQLTPVLFGAEEAAAHCARGLGIVEWASHERAVNGEPDVVLACAGDVPTLETLAAVSLLREHLPDLAVRVVNVVDLMRLLPENRHPHGLSESEFDSYFTADVPVIFAFHGYPWSIHRLTYKRANHAQIHVRGFQEHGTTTTPFDMVMLNDVDRYHQVMDVIDNVSGLGERSAGLRQQMQDARLRARAYTREFGEDIPEVANWTWGG